MPFQLLRSCCRCCTLAVGAHWRPAAAAAAPATPSAQHQHSNTPSAQHHVRLGGLGTTIPPPPGRGHASAQCGQGQLPHTCCRAYRKQARAWCPAKGKPVPRILDKCTVLRTPEFSDEREQHTSATSAPTLTGEVQPAVLQKCLDHLLRLLVVPVPWQAALTCTACTHKPGRESL